MADRGIRDGVQVNAINPGPTLTDRLRGQLERLASERGITAEQAAAAMVESNRMTRLGQPQDIAALAQFVLSPAGRQFHGALIDMDGGQTKTI
jgi:NAD(P)-dependent dehydrogenase (short-subunit alcohol dehydrogenase family)